MTSAALPPPHDIPPLTPLRRPHYRRWLAAALILVAFGFLAKAFAEGQIAWTVVGQFFTAPAILQGLWGAVWMTFCAMALGIALGVLFAVMAMSPNPVLKAVATFYIWFFRGTPLLLQLLIWLRGTRRGRRRSASCLRRPCDGRRARSRSRARQAPPS